MFLGVVHAQPVTGAVPDQHAEVDFAAVTYLHKLGFDLDWRLPELFPRGELSIALDLADALLPVQVMQVGQDLFGALDRRLDDVFSRRRVQRRLPKADAEEILSLAPEPDLIDQMPRLFATDLRAAVEEKARHQRVVLLFDTHEAFLGEAIADAAALVHAGDRPPHRNQHHHPTAQERLRPTLYWLATSDPLSARWGREVIPDVQARPVGQADLPPPARLDRSPPDHRVRRPG